MLGKRVPVEDTEYSTDTDTLQSIKRMGINGRLVHQLKRTIDGKTPGYRYRQLDVSRLSIVVLSVDAQRPPLRYGRPAALKNNYAP